VSGVLESFSAGVEAVVVAATTEARQLGQHHVGTEHLLLGLLSEGGETADLLRVAGAGLAAARHTVAEVSAVEAGSMVGESVPFTARAQRALERAGRFARQQRQAEIGTGHVLLGVLDVEGLACQVLRGLGVDIGRLRDAVGSPREHIATDPSPPSESAGVRPRCQRCWVLLDETLTQATVAARKDGDAGSPASEVKVLFCGACGTAVGVLPHRK
jgi:ATP-dependent Clp protease ATP-binding subunit ClpA